MPLQYKIDLLQALKDKGYSTYSLRQKKYFSESTIQKFRKKEPLAWENIQTLCRLLECQPSDLFEYVPDDVEE